jgi:hypothetical protein
MDLFDCLLLKAAALDHTLDLSVAAIRGHFRRHLSAAGWAALAEPQRRIAARTTADGVPLIMTMNRWVMATLYARLRNHAGAINHETVRRTGIARWQAFFHTLDGIFRVSAHSLALLLPAALLAPEALDFWS